MAQFADGDRTGDIILAITIDLPTEYSPPLPRAGFFIASLFWGIEEQ
jgi:hypothetical protein